MIEKKVNLNLFIASDRVSKQNIHPCLKSRIVGYCYIVNIDEKGAKVYAVLHCPLVTFTIAC